MPPAHRLASMGADITAQEVFPMSAVPSYPVRVEGKLDPRLSRWLWLVKWLLAIPHYVVLAFLWVAFVLLSVVALVAIVATGRYPRAIFDFNVGVLRWTWRVGFYSCSALATDRYPPFTLGEAPGYPATLEVQYPEHLSRGLALVKWWLLAIPHYLVVAFFVGGGTWLAWHADNWAFSGGPGLIGLLLLVAAVALLFTGRYPRGIFDLVLGLDRWALRVAAYAGLMTDRYPPFRLDMGGREPGSVTVETTVPPAPPAPAAVSAGWSGGRVLLVVLGSVTALVALVLLLAGGAAVAVDQTQRENGFVTTPTEAYATPTFALVSETAVFDGPTWAWRDLVGTVRIRSQSDHPVFLGIAQERDVAAYLEGVAHERVLALGDNPGDYELQPGSASPADPAAQTFWAASAQGTGLQEVDWNIENGSWSVVLMNADGSRNVDGSLSVGAELDALLWIGIGLLGAGLVFALVAAGLVYGGVPKRGR